MKKTPVAETASAAYSASSLGAAVKSIAKAPPGPSVEKAIRMRILDTVPKGGARYKINSVIAVYDVARDCVRVCMSLLDSKKLRLWEIASDVDRGALRKAASGDWSSLDVRTKHMVSLLVERAVQDEVKNTQPKENEHVSNQTEWAYVVKDRDPSFVRESPPSSEALHPSYYDDRTVRSPRWDVGSYFSQSYVA